MVYVGCVLIVILSAIIGKGFSDKYVMRDKFYRHLVNMCLYFKMNIGFNHTKLEQLFDEFENLNNQDFFSETMFLKKICIRDGYDVTDQELKTVFKSYKPYYQYKNNFTILMVSVFIFVLHRAKIVL